jgi:Leucine-rich repeat (LRR) protein
LDKLVNLTELYLSENGIEKIENLEHNTKVETLDIAKNRIKLIENIGKLTEMDEFWVRSLRILVLFVILLILSNRPTTIKFPTGSASTSSQPTRSSKQFTWNEIPSHSMFSIEKSSSSPFRG